MDVNFSSLFFTRVINLLHFLQNSFDVLAVFLRLFSLYGCFIFVVFFYSSFEPFCLVSLQQHLQLFMKQ